MAEAPDDRPARLTPAERAQLKRDEKLADMQDQIDSGRLQVRKMTEEEMAEFEKSRENRRSTRGGPRGR